MCNKFDDLWFPEIDYDAEKSKELEINSWLDNPCLSYLWERRPSRLFLYISDRKLKNEERNRLPKLFSINYYPKEALRLLEGNKSLLDRFLKDVYLLKSKVVFPAVNINYDNWLKNNIITPLVSYSGFVDKDSVQKFLDENKRKYIETSKRLNHILKNHLNINFNNILIPELAFFVNEIEGDSYNLAYILNVWLEQHKNLYKNIRFFCTGEVDESGNINAITQELKKFEAAKEGSFDYVIFPTGNKKIIEDNYKEELDKDFTQALNSGTRKYLFFSTILELHNWLLENSDLENNKVMLWASTNRKEPNSELIKRYFDIDYYNYNTAFYKITQSLIDSDEKIKKIDFLTDNYLKYLKSDSVNTFYKLRSFLPKDILYYCYLYFFMSSNESNNVDMISKIYFDISSALTETNVDLSFACNRLDKVSFDFSNDGFELIKKRYYKLLCLLFRNPIELLYRLSLINEINNTNNSIGHKMLSVLIDESKKDKYQESFVMNKIFEVFSEDICVLNFESVAINKMLQKLLMAKINFENNHNEDACLACYRFFKMIINTIDNATIDDKNILCDLFNFYKCDCSEELVYKTLEKLKLKSFYRIIRNHKLDKNKDDKSETYYNIDKYKNDVNKIIKTINYLVSYYSNINILFSKMPISQIGYFPQIALDIYYFFEENQGEKNYKSIKNAFDKLYDGESIKLKKDCLDYWVGYNWGNQIKNINKFNSLPLIIGNLKRLHFCDKSDCQIINWLNNNKNSVNDLLWLFVVPKCKECLFERLKTVISDLYNSCKEIDSRNIIALKFIDTLFELNSIENNDFKQKVDKWLINREQRRTIQILAPIYLTLLNKENTLVLADNSIGQTNNSQFIIEFLSVFVLKDSPNAVFKPILWQSSIDNQMFNTIALTMLKDNYSLLKQFLLNKVNDLPNRLLALKMLKNYNKNE